MHYFFNGPFKGAGNYEHWEVAKFEPDSSGGPLEVYRLSPPDERGIRHCSCPSPKLPCKHADLLEFWFKIEERHKYFYDDVDNMFYDHGFSTSQLMAKLLGAGH